MPASPDLYWLAPRPDDWRRRVAALRQAQDLAPADRWRDAVALARTCLDFTASNALDAAIEDLYAAPPDGVVAVKLALLSTSTTTHLHAALRVGALRRGMALHVYEPAYGQYRQELADQGSALLAFAPMFILFAFDADTVAAHAGASTGAQALADVESYVAGLRDLWREVRDKTGAAIIQQTVMERLPEIGGGNDRRFPASRSAFVARVDTALREASDADGVDLLALDSRVAQDGLDRWFTPSVWHAAKQEVHLPAAPMWGDIVARIVGARLGRSAKCCVFDLDNTLWGGAVGDDGLPGIVVGEGSGIGEAFLAVQKYALELRGRGILLAICSKNDLPNALEPFERHPDMALRAGDIACFVANWEDKASNLRTIASRLNIGLDALVFVDDNPFERELVRAAAPEIFTPEVPEDPALVPRALADAGCFELVALTEEDRRRADLYAANAERDALKDNATDIASYLAGLGMVLRWRRFEEVDVVRLTQLINKTNQFNLTTRRLTEPDVRALMADESATCLQFRLLDRFGDNGIIAIVMGRLSGRVFTITDWLMSCRVLGRQVEEATLNVLVAVTRRLGASTLRGTYCPTARNQMVSDLLTRLGFVPAPGTDQNAAELTIGDFADRQTAIRIEGPQP